jgi:hypothetical protein
MNLWELAFYIFGLGVLVGLSLPIFDGQRIVWGAWHAGYLLWKDK